MALDTDLGIDSIKRVEILSALQEKLPHLPAVRPEDLGVLQTLGQIIDHLRQGSEQSASALSTPTQNSAGDRDEVASTLLRVVAEKTGYPVDMLELEMALDTDLGIDSIKRVEILSALQEQLPQLPAVRPEDLGVLQTLGQIIEHLCQSEEVSTQTGSSQPPQLGQLGRGKSQRYCWMSLLKRPAIRLKCWRLRWLLILISALIPSSVLKFFQRYKSVCRALRQSNLSIWERYRLLAR